MISRQLTVKRVVNKELSRVYNGPNFVYYCKLFHTWRFLKIKFESYRVDIYEQLCLKHNRLVPYFRIAG